MKNVANLISISRIIMSIVLFFLEPFTIPYYIVYTYCGASDVLDGFIARKLHIESDFGSKLDSIADIIFVFVVLRLFIPIIHVLHLNNYIYLWLFIIVLIKIVNMILGYIYYKKIVWAHTIANKITGIMIFIIPFIMVWFDIEIYVFIVCALATFAAIQEGFYIKKRKV